MNRYLSAQQRSARGNAIREYREAKIAQNNYLAEQRKQELEQLESQKYKSDANVFKRLGMTILDISGNVLSGAVKGLEGIMDLGAGAVGFVGGIFDKDFQNDVKGFIEKDYTSQYITNPIQEATKDSYTNDMSLFGWDLGGFIEETASGVGQMLPSVAMNIVVPGSGLGTLMAGASGNATEQAFNDGASYNKGLLYGGVSGAVEGATEKLFNGLGGLYGGGLLDKYTNKVAKQGISRIAKNALEEGAEEVLAEVANPITSMIYKGTDSLKDYTKKDYWKGVAKAGAIGATTSLAFNGTIGHITNVAKGQNADIDASIESINNINEASQKLFAENKLTNERFNKISSDVAQNYKNIEKVLQKQNSEKRANLIEKYQLNDKFDDNGNIKSKFALEIGLNENNADLNNNVESVSNQGVASYDTRYYNPRLKGKESEIQADLDRISTDLSSRTGQTQNIGVYSGELNDVEQSAYTKAKKAINNLNSKSGSKLNIVLVSPNNAFNGTIQGDKLYINKDNLESGDWAKTVIHEYTHFAEGTQEYEKLFDYLTKDTNNLTKSLNSVLNKSYGYDEEKLQNILDKAEKGEQLTEDEAKYHNSFRTEVNAHLSENVLGNEDFINKIVRSDDSLTEKIMHKIEDLLDMFKSIKSADGVGEYRRLKKAQRLYLKAIEASGKKYVDGKILRREEDEQKYAMKESEIDTQSQKEYDLDNGESEYGKQEKEATIGRLEKGNESGNLGRRLGDDGNRRWNVDGYTDKYLETIKRGEEELLDFDDRQKYAESLNGKTKHYKHENGWGFDLVQEDDYVPILKELKQENKKLGVNTEFFINSIYNQKPVVIYKNGVKIESKAVACFSRSTNTIYLPVNDKKFDFVALNRHERFHYLSKIKKLKAIEEYKNKIYDALTFEEEVELDRHYSKTYPQYRNSFFNKFEEISGDIYSGRIWIQNEHIQDSAKEELNNAIKKEFGLKELKYSLKDSQGNELSKEQAEFFKDSKVRDENGNLLVVYHGTLVKEINKFDKEMVGSRYSFDDEGFFFIDRKNIAESYSRSEFNADRQGVVIPAYILGKNPLVVNSEYLKNNGYPRNALTENDSIGFWDAFAGAVLDDYHSSNYDSIIVDDGMSKMVVAFEPNQIKRIDNKTPTKSDDIRYSLKDSEGNELSKEQQEFFKNSKVRDKNGNLLVVYHGTNSEFFEFDKSKIKVDNLGKGFYFVNKREIADSYAIRRTEERGGKERVISGYINSIKPFDISNISDEEIKSYLIYDYMNRKRPRYEYRKKYGAEIVDAEQYANDLMNDEDVPINDDGTKDYSVLFSTKEENFQKWLQENKYDSLIVEGEDVRTKIQGIAYVIFDSNKFKLTSNKQPTESNDIRYSMKGQAEKKIASKTKLKFYNKADAERVIDNAINLVGIGDKFATIKGSTREELIDKLWIGLNSKDEGYRGNVCLEVADFLLDHAVMESLYEDELIQDKLQKLDILREYTKSMNLSGIKDEIKYRDLKDAYLIWGITSKSKSQGEKGRTPDVVVQELNERGFNFEETNEADCFRQIYDLHKELIKETKKKHKESLNELASPEKRKELQQQIAREIMLAYDRYGTKTELSNTIDKYVEKINTLKTKLNDTIERNNVVNRVLDKVQKFRDMKLGRFINATQYKPELFKNTIGKLGNIKFRGDLNKSGTRDIIRDLNDWYSKDNERLEGFFNDEVSGLLTQISSGKGDLSTEELRMLGTIADYFKHFIENYNKIYREGKYIDAMPLAERYVNIINRNKKVKVGWLGRFNTSKFYKLFGDPLAIMRRMDNYKDNGFFTETFRELEKASVNAEITKLELNESVNEFLKKNKTFLKDIKNQTVTYNGIEISKDEAFSLYMSLQRQQAKAGLMISGFKFVKDKETIRVDGLMNDSTTTELINQKALEESNKLYKQFSEIDKQYIKIAEKLFNEDCKDLKKQTDLKRQGYSNVLENDYYYPISRAFIAHNVDTSYVDEMNRATNASFNKDTVKGAKGELAIEPLSVVLGRHTSAIAMYANLSIPIDNYNRVFNLNIGENKNKPLSVNSEIQNVWEEGNKYFKKLISDMQGIKTADRTGSKLINYLRGSYAKYQLGANLKVWLTQLSSYIASFNILSIGSLTKGLAVKVSGEELDKYCKLAKVRNSDNTAGKAQSVLDNVGKAGDFLMKPIGVVDRLVIRKLFGACQVEVQSKNGLKVGTEENKIKAGELLEKIILDTQQNSIATERSSAMRSDSEMLRSLTMFTADSMKNFGRWIDSISKISVIRAELKTDIDAETRASLESELKQAKKQFAKSTTTMVVIASFMAVIAQAFKYIYNKEDKDEDVAKTMTTDAIGNLFGGLPIIKDVYTYFSDGYEVQNFAYSMFNDVLDGFENVFDVSLKAINGENVSQQDIMSSLRKFVYSLGQLAGIPTRNIYNLFYGITSNISPSTGYKINNVFYNQNYRSDLQDAIEKGDEDMIATIAGLITNESVGKVKDKATRDELNRLIGLGFDALPKSIGETITNDGESIKLSRKQRNEFEETYGEGLQAVSRMMKTSLYEKSSDEIKAKSVKFIYDYYYEQAKADLFGLEDATKTMLFAEAIDIETLAIAIQTAKQYESDLDKNGKTISGTRKVKIQKFVNSLKLKAVQKYMIMGYLGYTNKQGESQVKAYINSLNLTKIQKEELLKMSGY